jgi:hypothetical protein
MDVPVMAIEENSERGRVEEGVLNELRIGHRPSLSLIATHDYLADRRGKVPFAHHAPAEEAPPISATRPSGPPRRSRTRRCGGRYLLSALNHAVVLRTHPFPLRIVRGERPVLVNQLRVWR